jgi:hypothetical protein
MKQQTSMTFTAGGIFLSLLAALAFVPPAAAQDDQGEVEKVLVLHANGIPGGTLFGHDGQDGVIHISVEEGQTTLEFSLTGLTPNAVHSVWLILDTGEVETTDPVTGKPVNLPCGGTNPDGTVQPACHAPFVSCSGPQCVVLDPGTGTNGNKVNVLPFTPAAADDAGFKAGMGLDPNGFVTDGDGNANFTIKLNYDIFQPGVAPTLLRPGITQSLGVAFDGFPGTTCSSSPGASFPARIDSGYTRVYNTATVANLPAISPSYQLTDASGKPLLVRAGVRGFQLIEHFDRLTHGHLPGFHVSNPAASSCGDFENRLTGKLADATADD